MKNILARLPIIIGLEEEFTGFIGNELLRPMTLRSSRSIEDIAAMEGSTTAKQRKVATKSTCGKGQGKRTPKAE